MVTSMEAIPSTKAATQQRLAQARYCNSCVLQDLMVVELSLGGSKYRSYLFYLLHIDTHLHPSNQPVSQPSVSQHIHGNIIPFHNESPNQLQSINQPNRIKTLEK